MVLPKAKKKREDLFEIGIYFLLALSKDEATKNWSWKSDAIYSMKGWPENCWTSKISHCSTMESKRIFFQTWGVEEKKTRIPESSFILRTQEFYVPVNIHSNRPTHCSPNFFMFCVFVKHGWPRKVKSPNWSWETIKFTEHRILLKQMLAHMVVRWSLWKTV